MKFIFSKLIPIILLCSTIQKIESKEDTKIFTFTDLQNLIDNSDYTIKLLGDYVFDPKVDKPTGIIIKKPIDLICNSFYINGLSQSKIFTIINTEV